ncbi:hypothetical protein [Solimonas marina]|uniref:Uncharacterized protein n=1 Tax=Solimonas marina TaxID=2714601 RepID=A0A970B4Y6_9GAMM|nr:hypothetical protein [Solimonas marina]NKF21128.1 hypothetical protein [Solimonas marina]
MNTQILPAYGSHDEFSARIERSESLLFNALLLPLRQDHGARAVIVSRTADGQHWLRVCEGADERWMRWTEQRRLRMQFGQSYAEALAQAWIARWEREGWKLEWSQQAATDELPVAA